MNKALPIELLTLPLATMATADPNLAEYTLARIGNNNPSLMSSHPDTSLFFTDARAAAIVLAALVNAAPGTSDLANIAAQSDLDDWAAGKIPVCTNADSVLGATLRLAGALSHHDRLGKFDGVTVTIRQDGEYIEIPAEDFIVSERTHMFHFFNATRRKIKRAGENYNTAAIQYGYERLLCIAAHAAAGIDYDLVESSAIIDLD